MPVELKVVLIGLVLVAGIYDLRYRKIPNWVSMSGIVLGVGTNLLLQGLPGLRTAALGLLVAAAIYLPLYLVRGMGAGDVKLMAAVGTIAGPMNWLQIFLVTAIFGGIVSLVVVSVKRRTQHTLMNVVLIASELVHFRDPANAESRLDVRHSEALRLPHGAVIAAGCMAFLALNG